MKKKMVMLLSGLCLGSLLLVGCSEMENNIMRMDTTPTIRNYLKVDNVEYDLSAGVFENYGIDYDNNMYLGYNTDIMLYSKDLSLQKNENDFYMFAGKGNAIHFQMFSTSGKELDSQEYVFSSKTPFQVGTFGNGVVIHNLNKDFQRFYPIENKNKLEIIEGKVVVSKEGDEYNIAIECVCEDGLTVTGSYIGKLPNIDWPLFDT